MLRPSAFSKGNQQHSLLSPRPHLLFIMAAKTDALAGFAPVLAALATMQSNAPRGEKGQAHEFLEQFQKSVS
jgi:hypothetical protein